MDWEKFAIAALRRRAAERVLERGMDADEFLAWEASKEEARRTLRTLEASEAPATVAVAERAPGAEGRIWHLPDGLPVEEFQPIACCADTGITLPSAWRWMPLRLDRPDERWCPDCLWRAEERRR